MVFESGLGASVKDMLSKTKKSKNVNKGFLEVEIETISLPKNNPRRLFPEEKLQELAESIKTHGILQPIVVMKIPGGYEILAGERRYRAAKLASLKQIPVTIRETVNEQNIAEERLIENIQREDLNPVEIARAYKILMQDYELTQENLSERLGKSRSNIANSVRLLTLPDYILSEIMTGNISTGHAKVLAGVTNEKIKRAVAKEIVEEGISVRETEKRIKGALFANSPNQPENPMLKKDKKAKGEKGIKEQEYNLSKMLGCKVSIRWKGGKGKISLHFETNDQYSDLVDIMDHGVHGEPQVILAEDEKQ